MIFQKEMTQTGSSPPETAQAAPLDPDALNSGDKTVTVPLTEDTDYAIVPLMAQVEYPADGSRTDVLVPENVTLLDYYGEPAQDTTVLHSEYAETSAAATGLYLLTDEDFTAQFVYTAPDGNGASGSRWLSCSN